MANVYTLYTDGNNMTCTVHIQYKYLSRYKAALHGDC